MRKVTGWTMLLVTFGLGAALALGGHHESDLRLEDVPEAVRNAALEQVPGIRLVEAEVEREGGVLVYELEGVLDGKEYEIEVIEDGTVVEVESGDDEDEEDDEDEGEDEDEGDDEDEGRDHPV